ncbi:TonB-dependent receptor [Nevskia sp.]|uniref:TonB-dependent receptor n=1 Tax=Nevskia sp. TaxID=1929292 RepID=UPI003F71EE4C
MLSSILTLNRGRLSARLAFRAALLMMIGGAPAAFADDSAPEAAGSADPTQLKAVTVTAERRRENIRDVPISVSTLSDENLGVLVTNGQDVRLLAARVPSLNIESSFGRAFPRFYIRGYGNTDFDLNASQPVSLVYDDVVLENPLLKGFPIFDLAQIEVARGPQGTLFGRNTPAGVVKFDSARPTFDQGGYFNLSTGTYLTTNVESAYNIPLSKTLALRVSGLLQRREDWVDNLYSAQGKTSLEGYTDGAFRAQLLYQPSATFSALFNVHTRQLKGTARLFRANIIEPGTNDLVSGFRKREVAIDGRNEQDLHGTGGSVRLRWDVGAHSLYSISGYEHVISYSRGDIDGGFGAAFAPPSGPGFIPFPAESADGLPKHQQLTQEFRIESNYAGPVNFQGGVYYFFEDITIDSFNFDTLAGGVQNGYAVQEQQNNAAAVFGSVTYAVTPDFKLKGGVRYTVDNKNFVAEQLQSPIGAPPTGELYANPYDTDVSWDVSGTYKLTPTVSAYARVARGFRAPSVQGRLLFGSTLSVAKSETVLSYETGIKADLFDKRARIAFNLFRSEVEDQQLTAVGGGANFNTLINADKALLQGAELDFKAILTRNLLLTLGASYNYTEIQDAGLAVAPCGSGCTVLDPQANGSNTVIIDGNRLPQAPRVTGNATLRYGHPVGAGEAFVLTDWAYRSTVNFFLYESVEYKGKYLLEGGLRAGYLWGDGRFELAAFARNITGTTRVVGGIDFNNLTGFINEPRLIGAQFKASF